MVRILPVRRLIKSPGNPIMGARNMIRFARRAAIVLSRLPAYQSGSYAGRILFDEYTKMKGEDSTFSLLKKNMDRNYTERAIAKIQRKYIKKPEEMDAALK